MEREKQRTWEVRRWCEPPQTIKAVKRHGLDYLEKREG